MVNKKRMAVILVNYDVGGNDDCGVDGAFDSGENNCGNTDLIQ